MYSINAVSISPDGRAWLEDSRDPGVLHVFENACNLINERREVLSVVVTQIGEGPFNLVVDTDIRFSERLDATTPISVRDGEMILGDLTIATAAAPLWSSRPNWERLHADRAAIVDQLSAVPWMHHRPALPSDMISALSLSVAAADGSGCLVAARGLAGLGIGLTPAGDDLLLGAVYASWLVHPVEVARVLAREIAHAAAPLTTSLSAAWLRSAGKGEAGVRWHRLFEALIAADLVCVNESLEDILAMGETSGADALAGFFDVLSSHRQLQVSEAV